ncbi:putative molybdenum carrier protein [Bdellovibrionota bacterium]
MIKKLTSGGQSGVDRAALDIALELGLECGGWCPKGRVAEDGMIDNRYPLKETPTDEYVQRTEWNVRDADGTLILCRGTPTGGTGVTKEMAAKHKKPCIHVNFFTEPMPEFVRNWASQHNIKTLNIAGPRESKNPGIYDQATKFLKKLFEGWKD